MNSRPRLLIADDHEVVAESLALLLHRWFDVVSTVTTLRDVLPAAAATTPDAALLDYSFGGAGNCIPTIAPLVAAVPGCRVVVLTAHDSCALAATAIAAGASAFVSKSASPDELRLTIESALRRDKAGRSTRQSDAPPSCEPRTGQRDPAEQLRGPFGITPREAAMLLLLYRGMKRTEIAAELGVVPKTVEYYRTMIGRKLGITRMPLLLRWVGEHHAELEHTCTRRD